MGKVKYKKKSNGKLDGSYRSPVSPTKSNPRTVENSSYETESSSATVSDVSAVFRTLVVKPPHVERNLIPIEVVETIDYFEQDIECIEFENNSSNHDEEWVTLFDMQERSKAGNNCFAATTAVTGHLVEKVGVPHGWTNYEVELYYTSSEGKKHGDGVHWANVLKNDDTGEEWVIDYTARQFDETASFPLIARRQEWRQWVSSIIRNQYGGELQDETLH